MSTISDVQDLYGTLHTTWSKLRVHAISHIVFVALVFWMGGITSAYFSLPDIKADEIIRNGWYRLAKDTGLVYVILALPVVVASVYLTVFTLLAQAISLTIATLCSPPHGNPFSRLSALELAPIALSLPNDEFDLAAIALQSQAMRFKFLEQKSDAWDALETMRTRAGSSIQYCGDFFTLLLFWLILFISLRTNSWIQMSWAGFWPIFLILLALVWISSIRASRAFAAQPSLQMKLIGMLMSMDPSYVASLVTQNDTLGTRIKRLEELLKVRKDEQDQRKLLEPSFRRVFGLTAIPEKYLFAELSDRSNLSFYERGRRLDLFGSPRDLSVADVVAYKFFIRCKGLRYAYASLLMLFRSLITGFPM